MDTINEPKSISNLGDINVSQLILSLGKNDGFTYIDMIKELLDNADDAGASNVTLDILKELIIKVTDNGLGLSSEGWVAITQLYSVKNDSGTKHGKFGIGSKKAMAGLSDLSNEDSDSERMVEIVSKMEGKSALRTGINYESYIKGTEYRGSITAVPITDKEWAKYSNYSTGTVIKIKTTKKVLNILTELMDTNSFKDNMRLDLSKTYYKKVMNIHLNGKILSKWEDYADKKYNVTFKCDIHMKNDKLVYTTQTQLGHLGIDAIGRGHSTKLECISTECLDKMKYVGSFTLKLNIPDEVNKYRTKGYMDSQRRGMLKKLDMTDINSGEYQSYINDINVIRNNKVLSKLPFTPPSGARTAGSSKPANAYSLIEKNLSFSSDMDDILGLTQENKSQSDWKNTPRGFERFINELVKKYFDNIIKIKKPQAPVGGQAVATGTRGKAPVGGQAVATGTGGKAPVGGQAVATGTGGKATVGGQAVATGTGGKATVGGQAVATTAQSTTDQVAGQTVVGTKQLVAPHERNLPRSEKEFMDEFIKLIESTDIKHLKDVYEHSSTTTESGWSQKIDMIKAFRNI